MALVPTHEQDLNAYIGIEGTGGIDFVDMLSMDYAEFKELFASNTHKAKLNGMRGRFQERRQQGARVQQNSLKFKI
jgi:hypothetical protein